MRFNYPVFIEVDIKDICSDRVTSVKLKQECTP